MKEFHDAILSRDALKRVLAGDQLKSSLESTMVRDNVLFLHAYGLRPHAALIVNYF